MSQQSEASHQVSKKDQWTPALYTAAASFVPKLTAKVVDLLAPSPSDKILDLGCGDGHLTHAISQTTPSISGLDSSASMISSANQQYPHIPFAVQDCTALPAYLDANPQARGSFTKVFSNAAMHWILTPAATRQGFFESVRELLAPGGAFVFEMGGAGCVAEVRATTLAALKAHGIPFERARAADPFFFPSENWMRDALTRAGLTVETLELEYRPTKLNERNDEGTGGLEGWVRLMCSALLELLDEDKRDDVVKWIVEVLQPVLEREDGSWWIGYTRLRGVARRS